MLGDLHIHSKYSSHALYVDTPSHRKKLSETYPARDLCEEKPSLIQKLLIDGTSHIENIMDIARRRNLKIIAITDHNTTIGSQEAMKLANKYGLIVVPGMELSTQSGEILAYGITGEIHKQGGIAIVAHPFNRKHPQVDYARIDEEEFKKVPIDGMEVFNVLKGVVDPHFLDLAKQMKVGITGGSDAHLLYQIGKGLTIFPDSCKNWQDVIQSLKERETYVSGMRINFLRVGLDYMWCNTLGRLWISRRWGTEGKNSGN